MDRPSQRQRITLDGQFVGYWAREAARLDALAAGARFGWQRRRFARKAADARERGQRFAASEAARGAAPETAAG